MNDNLGPIERLADMFRRLDGVGKKSAMRYAFCVLDKSWRPYTPIDYRIANDMADYFAAFASIGIPAAAGLAEWKPLRNGNRQFMHFGDEPCAMCYVPEEHLDSVQKRGKPFPSV